MEYAAEKNQVQRHDLMYRKHCEIYSTACQKYYNRCEYRNQIVCRNGHQTNSGVCRTARILLYCRVIDIKDEVELRRVQMGEIVPLSTKCGSISLGGATTFSIVMCRQKRLYGR